MSEQTSLETTDEKLARLEAECAQLTIRAESAEGSVDLLMGDIETLERKVRFKERQVNDLKGRLNKEALAGDYPDEIRRIFAYWQKRCGKPKCKLDDSRAAPVRKRLQSGRSEQEIMWAIDGAALDAFVTAQGLVKNDLALICQDDVKLQLNIERREAALARMQRAAEA